MFPMLTIHLCKIKGPLDNSSFTLSDNSGPFNKSRNFNSGVNNVGAK